MSDNQQAAKETGFTNTQFNAEYALEQFREEQSDYFDEEGKVYGSIKQVMHLPSERMFDVINKQELYIKQLVATNTQVENLRLSNYYLESEAYMTDADKQLTALRTELEEAKFWKETYQKESQDALNKNIDLSKELEAVRAEKWISVDDRLPETEFAVLVCVKNKVWRYLCYYLPARKKWMIMDSAAYEDNVTHWMDFPLDPPISINKKRNDKR